LLNFLQDRVHYLLDHGAGSGSHVAYLDRSSGSDEAGHDYLVN
jgi:hypothetical protein